MPEKSRSKSSTQDCQGHVVTTDLLNLGISLEKLRHTMEANTD
jgi:hypothetical protein